MKVCSIRKREYQVWTDLNGKAYNWKEDRQSLRDRIEEEDGYVFAWSSVVLESGYEKMGDLTVEVYNGGASFAY